jgi:hypothetical protein
LFLIAWVLRPSRACLATGCRTRWRSSVFNANHNFATTATLLLYLDHESSQVTGRVTLNTLAANPIPTIVENLSPPAADGTIKGTVIATASRQFAVAGEVKISHGLVRTHVTQRIDFSNGQQFVSNPNSGSLVQDITQSTSISSLTQTSSSEEHTVSLIRQQWPLVVNVNFVPNPDGSFTQATDIKQEFHRDDVVERNGDPVFFSTVSNVVKPSDTLFLSPSFAITGNTGQLSSQQYFSRDSSGACYSRSITAATGALTSITDGEGCEREGEGQH